MFPVRVHVRWSPALDALSRLSFVQIQVATCWGDGRRAWRLPGAVRGPGEVRFRAKAAAVWECVLATSSARAVSSAAGRRARVLTTAFHATDVLVCCVFEQRLAVGPAQPLRR
jgi:hypothetical protein